MHVLKSDNNNVINHHLNFIGICRPIPTLVCICKSISTANPTYMTTICSELDNSNYYDQPMPPSNKFLYVPNLDHFPFIFVNSVGGA